MPTRELQTRDVEKRNAKKDMQKTVVLKWEHNTGWPENKSSVNKNTDKKNAEDGHAENRSECRRSLWKKKIKETRS